METYEASKTCKNCATKYSLTLSKYEAAFDGLSNKILKEAKCPKCGETEYQSAGLSAPDIDDELMEIWIKDENLFFLQQDEDIEMIIRYVDRDDILPLKRSTLLSSLCIIIFDSKNTKKRATEALLERKDMLIEAKKYIYDYIGKKVFPKLGLKWN